MSEIVIPDGMLSASRKAVFKYIQTLSSVAGIDDNHLAKVALEAAFSWEEQRITDDDLIAFASTCSNKEIRLRAESLLRERHSGGCPTCHGETSGTIRCLDCGRPY